MKEKENRYGMSDYLIWKENRKIDWGNHCGLWFCGNTFYETINFAEGILTRIKQDGF